MGIVLRFPWVFLFSLLAFMLADVPFCGKPFATTALTGCTVAINSKGKAERINGEKATSQVQLPTRAARVGDELNERSTDAKKNKRRIINFPLYHSSTVM